jgi:phage host-nuclease inhibitor protein Gam
MTKLPLLQDLDYEDLVSELIEKYTEQLPNLKKLTVRRLQRFCQPLEDEVYDRCKCYRNS